MLVEGPLAFVEDPEQIALVAAFEQSFEGAQV